VLGKEQGTRGRHKAKAQWVQAEGNAALWEGQKVAQGRHMGGWVLHGSGRVLGKVGNGMAAVHGEVG